MKAWVMHGYNDMRLEERAEPSLPHENWVKLRVRTVQPSITECVLFSGLETYNADKIRNILKNGPAPLFGHEFCADVVEVGPAVSRLSVGQRVASRSLSSCGTCYLCRGGNRDFCQKGVIVGFDIPGAFAEYVATPEDSVVPIPDSVSDEAGATVQALSDAVAGVSAAQLRMADVVVVIGLGVLGLACAQAALVSGAGRVIGIDVKQKSLDLARSLGVTELIDSSTEDAETRVLELTGGAGADVVIETAGGQVSQGLGGADMASVAARMARDNGTVVGLSLNGEAAVLPYSTFRHRSIRYVFPDPLSLGLSRHVVQLVGSGLIEVHPLLAPPLEGIEEVPNAFYMTANKAQFGLMNPAQVRIAS